MLEETINRTFAYLKDPLRKNAFYLIANGILSGVLGFVFWVIVARFYTTTQVGLASTIISAAGLIAIFSNPGFRIGLIRFISGANERANDMINSCFTIGGVLSISMAIIFLAGLDIFFPALLFIRSDIIFMSAFIIFTMCFVLAALQDSVFIAARQAKYTLIKNMILGVLKIPIPVFLVAFGAFGIFSSYGIAYIIGLLFCTCFFIPRVQPGYLPIPTIKKSIVNDIFHFSIGNHIADIQKTALPLILPLMITSVLNPEMTAYFYIAWMIATLLFLIPGAITTSLLAEGSYDMKKVYISVIKATKFILILLIPSVISMFLFGDRLLLLFGKEYSESAVEMLWILGLSSIPVAVNSIYVAVKRVQMEVAPIIYINTFIAVSTLVASYILMTKIGLIGIGFGWIGSQGIVATMIGLIVIKNLKKR